MSTSVDQILEELGLLDKEAEDNTNQEENFDKELMELIGEDVTDTEKIAEELLLMNVKSLLLLNGLREGQRLEQLV